jgi:hypothetical protein
MAETNDERERPSVKVSLREEVRCDDGQAAGEENASKGVRHRGRPSRGPSLGDLRIDEVRGGGRARNVANPMAGCRAQQTCRLPRAPLFAAGPAAEETVEAGRNGKDGT